MVEEHKETPVVSPEVAAKNRRLAIILALVAAAFYLGFILMNLK
ncbi:MAG: cytochrome oxidase small assembly protein [Gammaproteobacteria bacterium]